MKNFFCKAALLCSSGLLAAAVSVQAAPKGKVIEFSEPRNERGLTNSPGPLPGRTSLDRIEAELNGPLRTILKGNSLEGMIMPAPQPLPPPVLPQRIRENTDRKRDQLYSTPEDLYTVKSIEDVYKAQELTPDGRRVRDLRPMEKWVRQTLGAVPGTNRAAAGRSSILEDVSGAPGQESLNPVDSLLKKELRKAFGLDANLRDRAPRELQGFRDGFNQAQGGRISTEEFQRRESFMQTLDANYVPAPAGSTPGASGFATPYVNSSFYDPPRAAPAASTPVVSSAPSASTAQPDLWKSSFVQPVPVAKPEPPAPPVSPFMNAPRRSL